MLVKGLHEAGWMVEKPKASMYVWAQIPARYRAPRLARIHQEAACTTPRSSVSPGIGFGEFGDGHVRFALIENEARTRQAIRGIKQMFREDGVSAPEQPASVPAQAADPLEVTGAASSLR